MTKSGPENCPECGKQPKISEDITGATICCPDCYDGAPDSYPKLLGSSVSYRKSPKECWCEAVDDWNMQVEEYLETRGIA